MAADRANQEFHNRQTGPEQSTPEKIQEPEAVEDAYEEFAYEEYETEDAGEEEDFAEEDELDEEDVVIRFKPWMIPAFVGMMILAILICIPLWRISRHGGNTNNSIAAVTTESRTTESQMTEATSTATETENTVAVEEPQITPDSETVISETVPTPTKTPETVPAATPEVQITPAVLPESTELPATGNAGDALAEGNSMTFGEVNETVTAKNETNLRSEPYTGDTGNVVGQLKNGETLPRTGRNDSTGWSRLTYNGQTVYAVSAYLTTDLSYKTPEKPSNPNRVSTLDGRVIVFTDCDDYITPKELINLRTEPSTSEGESTVRTQVKNGTNLHRTGYSEGSGWSRVEYNGEILYAVTNYVISGTAPE